MGLTKPGTEDIDKIFALYTAKERWFKEQSINQWEKYTSPERFPKDYFAVMINEGRLFALTQDNEFTACCVLLNKDKDMWCDGGEEGNAFIKNLVSGRKGAGSVLINELSEHCRKQGYKSIRIDCRNDNEGLKAYYMKHGFIPVGTVPYDNTCNACLMSKSL